MLNWLNPHATKAHLPLSKFHLIGSLTAVSCVLLSVASPAQANTITNVSPQVFQCVRRNNGDTPEYRNPEGYVIYQPNLNDPNTGTVEVHSRTWGRIGIVNFAYNSSSQALTISRNTTPIALTHADFLARVQTGMQNTANWCRQQQQTPPRRR